MNFINKLIQKIVISRAVKAVNNFFKGGQMDGTKKWYQSKSIISGILTGVIASYNLLAPQLGWPLIPEWVYAILASTGIYSRITATTTIK